MYYFKPIKRVKNVMFKRFLHLRIFTVLSLPLTTAGQIHFTSYRLIFFNNGTAVEGDIGVYSGVNNLQIPDMVILVSILIPAGLT